MEIQRVETYGNFKYIHFSTGDHAGFILMDGDEICYCKIIKGFNETEYIDTGNEQIKKKIINRLRLKLMLGHVDERKTMTDEMVVHQTLKENRPFFFSQSYIEGEYVVWSMGSSIFDGIRYLFKPSGEVQSILNIIEYAGKFKTLLEQKNHPYIEINGLFKYENANFSISNIRRPSNGEREYSVLCNQVEEEYSAITFLFDQDHKIKTVYHKNDHGKVQLDPKRMQKIISFIRQFVEKVSIYNPN